MYTVLIVDDERLEREGIKLLINKYKLDVNVAEAANGQKAYEYLQSNRIDILFTDIKMPFMDGLELAEKAKRLLPDLKIIIFSAYGEFEYAKKAINIKVEHYILKPIIKSEFFKVFTEVVELCRKEEQEKSEAGKLLEGYRIGVQYEKEKILIDLINGINPNEQFRKRMELAGLDFTNKRFRILMIDFKSRFFDVNDEQFLTGLRDVVSTEFEYLNLNERQSLIFLTVQTTDREGMKAIGSALAEFICRKYALAGTIVISDVVAALEDAGGEFESIERVLDYKFFYDDSVVLFAKTGTQNAPDAYESIEKAGESIFRAIDQGDYAEMDKEIELLFENLKGKGSCSSIFVKYICVEIVRRIFSKMPVGKNLTFTESADRIFSCSTLGELKEALDAASTVIKADSRVRNEDANKKVIRDVQKLVEDNYHKDISVEWIAEKIYLSPNYLSFIFKKLTGQSLGKYITAYRLKVAEELLQNSNMKIVDISEKIGYSNASYFCLTFKSYYGVSPVKYREKDA